MKSMMMRLPSINQINFKLENFLLYSFCFCALFQCINVKIANLFQISSFILFFLYCFYKHQEVLQRLKKFKSLFILYGVYALFEFIPVLFSPDFDQALKIWGRTYFLRGFLFLILLISFDQKKQYFYVLVALIFSFVLDSVACLLITPETRFGERLTGFFGHPMVYAGFSCIVSPLFFYFSINEKRIWRKIGYCILTVFFFIILILNGTRGAWIAEFLVFVLILLSSKFSVKNLIVIGSLCVAGLTSTYYASKDVSSRINSLTNIETHLKSERVLLWKSSIEMFKDYPLTGVGLGEYGESYQRKYISHDAKEPNLTRAHSNIFQLLGESGLLGLLGYLILTFGIILLNLRSYKKTRNKLYLIASFSVLCLFLQGLTEYNLGHSAVMKFYWIWVGALVALGYYGSIKNESGNTL